MMTSKVLRTFWHFLDMESELNRSTDNVTLIAQLYYTVLILLLFVPVLVIVAITDYRETR